MRSFEVYLIILISKLSFKNYKLVFVPLNKKTDKIQFTEQYYYLCTWYIAKRNDYTVLINIKSYKLLV